MSPKVVAGVNDEVDRAVAADPDGPMFNPIAKAFHGAVTRNVSGVPGISPTFAVEVMCHPLLLALADAVLGAKDPRQAGYAKSRRNGAHVARGTRQRRAR